MPSDEAKKRKCLTPGSRERIKRLGQYRHLHAMLTNQLKAGLSKRSKKYHRLKIKCIDALHAVPQFPRGLVLIP